jgi:hypothetical protein
MQGFRMQDCRRTGLCRKGFEQGNAGNSSIKEIKEKEKRKGKGKGQGRGLEE